ncbi:D-alanyl-D-alanine carboxypeptidase [Candidatus Woesebacteria bacterium]|nr:D-alanyl-D-alanine carboxypeptidase [Candidatus Woesebacteria bacterium]
MPFRFYLLFIIASFFFAFYPGASPYYSLIAFNREAFAYTDVAKSIEIHDIPVVTAQTLPEISAQGAYIVELESFTPVFQKNQHTSFYPASTTKIITALVSRDLYMPEDIVTVGQPRIEGQTMGLVGGERITAENLLYGALVHSGNDAAYALADGKGYRFFIEKMNEKAQALGMKDSLFTNPSGLDDFTQKTTPFDLSLAARELLKDSYLRKIVGTKEIIISDVDYSTFHTLTNVNKLLGEIQGLGGLKTGQTEQAGENLVSFYRHNGRDYILVVMKSEDRFTDTRTLVEFIKSSISYTASPIAH